MVFSTTSTSTSTSSSSNTTERQARHTPCENCRTHRRKCTVPLGTQCERCQRMDLVCLFKYSKRTKAAFQYPQCGEKKVYKRKRISMTQKQMLMEDVEQLERLVVSTEADMESLSSMKPLLSITSCHQRLRLETAPLHSMADMIALLEHATRSLSPIMRTPRYFSDSSQGMLHITQQISQVEQTLRRFFTRDAAVLPSPPTSPLQFDDDDSSMTQIKRRFINAYFSCGCYIKPILVRPYFLPLLLDNPHSMLANAIIAIVAFGICNHISIIDLPISRKMLGAACMEKAYTQLRDALFDQEPGLETLATLRCLAGCHLLLLKSDDARKFTSLAWRMALQLKDTYLGTLKSIERDHSSVYVTTSMKARAETWRRLFYDIRYIELNLCMMYEGEADFSSLVLSAKHIGCPIVLDIEQTDPASSRKVEAYRYLIALSMLPGGSPASEWTTREEIVGYRLYAGVIDKVSCADIEHIEGHLVDFWMRLPRDYVLADSPLMAVLDMNRVRECNNPDVLYLNEIYYLYWTLLEMRFMATPSTADLSTTSLGRYDGERALLIVSVCCDALTKVALALYEIMPCALDIHWLVLIADLLVKLKDVADPDVKSRAQQNLQWTLRMLGNFMIPFGQPYPPHPPPLMPIHQHYQQQQYHPSSPWMPVAFYTEIQRLVAVYFAKQMKQIW
ncbi:hypothetical protein O0I10_002121 [Lichtheimia ornata]|uniref:Zn(2)-C6 fungal-type domain-containing protein n=1 Tax=Lichtheimia ornata TaxID=688661 RepID=A0AAD7VB68_9FUNG|nr:uncharacterized protein O0I10_002121 [Lichtheimia ornata]KAJ8662427.1 hypothetical protein O0I10_002121 [Lichtheimia ornata]